MPHHTTRFETGLLIALAFLSFFVTAIQWYTQHISYPISALVGPGEFLEYGSRYEGGLVIALYLPYFALLLVNAGLLRRRPSFIPAWALVASLLLNLSILLISFGLAVPIHRQDSAALTVSADHLRALLDINALRLAASSLASLLVIWFLAAALMPRGEPQPATLIRDSR